jgi:predicted nucleic acid-binding protein
VDSSALIDWLNGVLPVAQLFHRLIQEGHTLAACPISIAEVYSGLAEDEWAIADPVLDALEYWDIDSLTAKQAGSYRYIYARKGQPLSVPDTLMAALAVAKDATLITSNVRDFPMPELKLEPLPG